MKESSPQAGRPALHPLPGLEVARSLDRRRLLAAPGAAIRACCAARERCLFTAAAASRRRCGPAAPSGLQRRTPRSATSPASTRPPLLARSSPCAPPCCCRSARCRREGGGSPAASGRVHDTSASCLRRRGAPARPRACRASLPSPPSAPPSWLEVVPSHLPDTSWTCPAGTLVLMVATIASALALAAADPCAPRLFASPRTRRCSAQPHDTPMVHIHDTPASRGTPPSLMARP